MLHMTPDDSPRDLWESAGAYERFMGRWSRELARAFVSWLEVPPDRHWLEVGCGTGALTSGILEIGHPASVLATDASQQFIGHVRAALPDHRVEFLTASADELPSRASGYDVVASSLVLNFIPDPTAALRQMRSLAAHDGIVAACVWDYAEGMEFLRRFWDAAVELEPTAREYDEGQRFQICSPSALEAAFRDAGFSRVGVEGLQVPTHFEDFDDYWFPFVGGPGPAPGYLSSLPADSQQDLASRLAATLPRNSDGSITLTARAWAARAVKQGAA
jgi:ubiquinone/menaquinone biosynthesis C-methylase UbiE